MYPSAVSCLPCGAPCCALVAVTHSRLRESLRELGGKDILSRRDDTVEGCRGIRTPARYRATTGGHAAHPSATQAIMSSIRPSSIACFGLRKLSRSAQAKEHGRIFRMLLCVEDSVLACPTLDASPGDSPPSTVPHQLPLVNTCQHALQPQLACPGPLGSQLTHRTPSRPARWAGP